MCLVTREHFGLAHVPLLSQRHSNFCVSCVNLACVSCDEGAFRTCPCTSHFTRAFNLLCLMCKSCLCVCVSCDEGAFRACPCTSHFTKAFKLLCVRVSCDKECSGLPMHLSYHKGIRKFVSHELLNLACVFMCLVTRERSVLPMHLSFHKGI